MHTQLTHQHLATSPHTQMTLPLRSRCRYARNLTNLISGDLALLKSRAHKKETRHWHMNQLIASSDSRQDPSRGQEAMWPLTGGTPRSQGAHTALTAPTTSLPSGLKLHQKNNGATRRSCWWPWLAKQTIASSNMLPWHSCHWVRTAAYQTTAPFIKNVARASRWLYCEDALHRRFEAGHSAPTEIHGRLPPSPYRPRRHTGGGRSPAL